MPKNIKEAVAWNENITWNETIEKEFFSQLESYHGSPTYYWHIRTQILALTNTDIEKYADILRKLLTMVFKDPKIDITEALLMATIYGDTYYGKGDGAMAVYIWKYVIENMPPFFPDNTIQPRLGLAIYQYQIKYEYEYIREILKKWLDEILNDPFSIALRKDEIEDKKDYIYFEELAQEFYEEDYKGMVLREKNISVNEKYEGFYKNDILVEEKINPEWIEIQDYINAVIKTWKNKKSSY